MSSSVTSTSLVISSKIFSESIRVRSVLQHLLLRQAPLFELGLVGLLVALEELLLELVEALVELLVGDRDVELLGRDLELGLLDEAGDDRVAKLRELGRAGLRETLARALRRSSRPGSAAGRTRTSDLTVADDGDRVRRDLGAALVVVAAATGGRDPERERSEDGYETNPKRHGRAG